MGLVLDSSILIAAERGKFDIRSFLDSEAPMEDVFITSITASELLHGVWRATGKTRLRREAFVEAVIRDTPILTFDLASARRHAELWAKLESTGNRMGAHDMMIASVCLHFKHRIATLNEREFLRVDGLHLVDARSYVIE